MAATSRAVALPGVMLAAGAGFGAAAGLAWCVLMPFNQTLAVPGAGPATGYGLALAAVVVGAPAGAAAIAGRRTGTADQAAIAAAGAGGLAAPVILAGGWATVWSLPGLLDAPPCYERRPSAPARPVGMDLRAPPGTRRGRIARATARQGSAGPVASNGLR
jgi:hypothetical protein